jgi:CDP-paratose 2-epimerase
MTYGGTKRNEAKRTVLITGGAGFIGSNLAERLLADPGTTVRIFDNLSRRGVDTNLYWLKRQPGSDRLEFVRGDVTNRTSVCRVAEDVDEIYHLAAQVAVTTSIDDPRTDFNTNVLGTFNVLEAARWCASRTGRHPFVLFTSTNKVYGALDGVPVTVDGRRYSTEDVTFRGVTEEQQLDFHSPYGCSKGAGDQYVHDYARIYGLPAVVFRMSCIAGSRQFGTEDQGWVAHFLYSSLEGKSVTIYGNGRQVRDVLHVADLIDAMQLARANRDRTAGQIYNVGGGTERSVSVLEMLDAIAAETGAAPELRYAGVRPGDQPWYVSDTAKLSRDTGWAARRPLAETLGAIHRFWAENRELLNGHRGMPQQVEEPVAEEVRG